MKQFNPLTDALDLLDNTQLLELFKYNVSISTYKGIKYMYFKETQEHKDVAHGVSRGRELHNELKSRGIAPKFELAGTLYFCTGSVPETGTCFFVKEVVARESVPTPSFCSASVDSTVKKDGAPF